MNRECCCNCKHDLRVIRKEDGIVNVCELDGHTIGFTDCFQGICGDYEKSYIAKRKEKKKGEGND